MGSKTGCRKTFNKKIGSVKVNLSPRYLRKKNHNIERNKEIAPRKHHFIITKIFCFVIIMNILIHFGVNPYISIIAFIVIYKLMISPLVLKILNS